LIKQYWKNREDNKMNQPTKVLTTAEKLARLGIQISGTSSAPQVSVPSTSTQVRHPEPVQERITIIHTEPSQVGPESISTNSPTPPRADLEFAAKLGPQVHEIKEFNAKEFFYKLETLQAAIHQGAQGIPTYLEQINTSLNQYPELVHKLTPEKIGIIVSGCLKMTNTVMAEVITKKKGGGKVSKDEIDSMGF
jgi:hypothetical protein